jgi:hypothetical protein
VVLFAESESTNADQPSTYPGTKPADTSAHLCIASAQLRIIRLSNLLKIPRYHRAELDAGRERSSGRIIRYVNKSPSNPIVLNERNPHLPEIPSQYKEFAACTTLRASGWKNPKLGIDACSAMEPGAERISFTSFPTLDTQNRS